MAELNRNYSVSKDHYQSLLDKTFSAGMAADLEKKQQAEHFTILDLAQVPEKPFKPKRGLMLLGAFFGALAMSLGLAYLGDMMNSTVKFERELKAMLPANVALLAVVPQLQSASDRRSTDPVRHHRRGDFADRLRAGSRIVFEASFDFVIVLALAGKMRQPYGAKKRFARNGKENLCGWNSHELTQDTLSPLVPLPGWASGCHAPGIHFLSGVYARFFRC